jgi:hypothetical protein
LSRTRNTLGPIIGYHGCDREIAENVLLGKTGLKKSENDYDWLGPGIYFWVDSPERAKEWAAYQKKRHGWKEAAVVGAFIHPGLCLNLTDYGVNDSLITAYELLKQMMDESKSPLPVNTAPDHGVFLKRQLDCATIKMIHHIRKLEKNDPYDTVYGVFEEGEFLFPGSAFKAKTHVQLAVCNPASIIGYFRVT